MYLVEVVHFVASEEVAHIIFFGCLVLMYIGAQIIPSMWLEFYEVTNI